MSLVNDMLRDLEQRNERPADVPGNQRSVKAAQYVEDTPPNNTSRYALWFIGIAAIITTCWLLWQEQTSKTASTSAQIPPVADNAAIDATIVQAKGLGSKGVTPESLTDSTANQNVIVAEIPKAISGSFNSIESSSKVSELTFVETVVIKEIKWAGADFGGDLVVRLSGDADIQVLNQKENIIVIAFEGVALKTTLPLIASPFIKRLDIDSDSAQQDRTLLTLTTQGPSQFAFRVQQAPTTLVLGVIPQQVKPDYVPAETVMLPNKPDAVAEPVVVTVVDESSKPSLLKSGAELQVNLTVDEQLEAAKIAQPVTKTSQVLNDRKSADRARRMLSNGDIDGAEQLLREMISKRPNRAESSRGLLSTLLLSQGRTPEAQSLVGQSLVLHQQSLVLRKLQARIWMDDGKAGQAMSMLVSHSPSIQKDPEYYELMATAAQQKGEPQKAAKIYYQLLQLNNDVPRWWIGMGYALEQVKRYADARNAYQSGIQIPTIDSSLKNYARQRIQALAGR